MAWNVYVALALLYAGTAECFDSRSYRDTTDFSEKIKLVDDMLKDIELGTSDVQDLSKLTTFLSTTLQECMSTTNLLKKERCASRYPKLGSKKRRKPRERVVEGSLSDIEAEEDQDRDKAPEKRGSPTDKEYYYDEIIPDSGSNPTTKDSRGSSREDVSDESDTYTPRYDKPSRSGRSLKRSARGSSSTSSRVHRAKPSKHKVYTADYSDDLPRYGDGRH
ncbi:hypothetical protein NEDG_00570 [Nematocida displodere]|uniref:Uncharacterized protein n=1 Tax=Nematocida displodere TaxID=1805483 RepID=A0A177EBX2_9MICR|nr:hypothetical protein NEDG_00570 [Nematocida displodere]